MRVDRRLSLAAAAAALVPGVAVAGTLTFLTPPPNVAFSVTLTGANQVVTATQALDVSDLTASNAGWNITATSTTFSTGPLGHSLPATAVTIPSAPTSACDTGSLCTLAQNQVTYPYALPAALVAPAATKLFDAAANSGELNQTVTVTWQLAVPGNTFAGTYTSTWTISLASGP